MYIVNSNKITSLFNSSENNVKGLSPNAYFVIGCYVTYFKLSSLRNKACKIIYCNKNQLYLFDFMKINLQYLYFFKFLYCKDFVIQIDVYKQIVQ